MRFSRFPFPSPASERVESPSGASPLVGLVLVLLAGCAGSGIGIGGKYAVLGGATPGTIQLVRFVLASSVLWLALPLSGHQMRLPGALALKFALMGAVFQTGQAYGFFGALSFISAGAAILIFFLFPACVVAASMLVGWERFSSGRVLAVAMALLGCALVVGGPGSQPLDLNGVLLALLATLSTAAYVLVGDRLLRRANPLVAAAHVQAGAAAAMLLVAATVDPVDLRLPAQAWLGIGAVTLFGNLGAMLLMLAAIRRIGGSLAAIGGMIEVVVTASLGILLFAEPFGPGMALGALLILSAIALMQWERLRDPRPLAAQAPIVST